MKSLIYLISAIMSYSLAQGQARTPVPVQTPMTFMMWKQEQVAEAQSNLQKLLPLKSDEKTLARARETLANTYELTLEEYISVYLTTLQDSREDLIKLTEKLSNDETAQIIATLLKRSDAARPKPSALAGGPSTNIIK